MRRHAVAIVRVSGAGAKRMIMIRVNRNSSAGARHVRVHGKIDRWMLRMYVYMCLEVEEVRVV